jgi:hypothetical protein
MNPLVILYKEKHPHIRRSTPMPRPVIGCAVVVMGRDEAERLAEIGGYGTVAGPDPSLLLQPANAIRDALRRDAQSSGRAALGVGDRDLIEIKRRSPASPSPPCATSQSPPTGSTSTAAPSPSATRSA